MTRMVGPARPVSVDGHTELEWLRLLQSRSAAGIQRPAHLRLSWYRIASCAARWGHGQHGSLFEDIRNMQPGVLAPAYRARRLSWGFMLREENEWMLESYVDGGLYIDPRDVEGCNGISYAEKASWR